MSKKLTETEFKSLLNLVMVSDPWPSGRKGERTLKGLLDYEAGVRGYEDWVEAYHELQVDNDE